MTAAEYAAGLREFADWIEANSDTIARDCRGNMPMRFLVCRIEREGFAEAVAAVGPDAVRKVTAKYLEFHRSFAGAVDVMVYADLEKVAEKRVVGEKVEEIVEWTWLDDPALAEYEPLVVGEDPNEGLGRGEA